MPSKGAREENGSEEKDRIKVEEDEGCATDSTCATASDKVLDQKLTKEWQDKVGVKEEARKRPILTPRDPQRSRKACKTKKRRKRFSFAEFFAGLAGLTLAISAICEGLVEVWNPFDEINGGDFANDDQYAEALRKAEAEDLDWPHFAPPCKSFTKARRDDEWGKVPILRSEEKPEGFGCEMTLAANQLADRTAAFAERQYKRGRWFSIENPWESYMWSLKSMKRLLALPGVRLIRVDQCGYGGPYNKPTGILTNIPEEVFEKMTRRCPGVSATHTHTRLEGRVWSYAREAECWFTEEGGEYPEGMCQCWAEALKSYLTDLEGEEDGEEVSELQKRGKFGNTLVRVEVQKKVESAKVADLKSKKEVREKENEECLGGMRNPNKAVAGSKKWQEVGKKMSDVLDDVLKESPEFVKFVGELRKEKDAGSEVPTEQLDNVAAKAAERLARACEATGKKVSPRGWRTDLLRAIIRLAEDPDVDVPEWLDGQTPIGVDHEVPYRGVFPKADLTQAHFDSLQCWEEILAAGGPGEVQNYKSFGEAGNLATDELQRLKDEGHIELIGDWRKVTKEFRNAVATRIAVLIKEKANASTGEVVQKVRFIVDMRRSGVNGQVKVYERIVLPRGSDLVDGVLDLFETRGNDVELLVIDVSDAFLNLVVNPEERRYLIITDDSGRYYKYIGVPFGLGSAPLVWCRVAALLGRLGQAVVRPAEARIQIYVDDPAVAVAGATAKQRTWVAARILLVWMAVGAKLAWHKAEFGKQVQWIGAQYEILPAGVRATISSERIDKLLEKVEALEAKTGLVSGVRSLAGECSWVAGIIPRLRPFVSMLWAAAHACEEQACASGKPKHLVYHNMVASPLQWMRLFFSGQKGSLVRDHLLADRWQCVRYLVRTDASTTGLGAVLICARTLKPLGFLCTPITVFDRKRLGAPLEPDPAWMAEWEILAVLVALKTWAGQLTGQRTGFLLQMDSKAALGAALKLASPTPTVNLLAAEVSLALETLGVEVLQGEHYRGVINVEADALSRILEGKGIPRSLWHLKATTVPPRSEIYSIPVK